MRALLPLLLLGLIACGDAPRAAGDRVVPQPDAELDRPPYAVSQWTLPIQGNASQPDLVAGADGRLLLSWISAGGEDHALRFAAFDGERWSAPVEIARGEDWFVNWADTPHIVATGDGALWAHWLRKSAAAPYAYDVMLSRSGDGGGRWSEPVTVNDDGTATEHGFVSMWPQSRGAIGIAWLDGRNTQAQAPAGHVGHGGHGAGAMSLRVASVDAGLRRSEERELDARVCDCCQTDAAMTARGPLLVYRDRDEDEIRDVSIARLENGAWTAPRAVHADGWVMPACPVNGPSVSAHGGHAWVAWYTAVGEQPALRLVRSTDAGERFAAPIDVDRGEAVQGRVEVAADSEGAWVAWLREDAQDQSLWLARYAGDPLREFERIEVARLQGRGRATGFPQLAVRGGDVHLVWTDVVKGEPVLRGAQVGAAALGVR